MPSPRSAELGLRTPVPYRAVYEFFPAGIVVTDGRGQVQGTNLLAKRLLHDLVDKPNLRCCDIFDCRRAGTPLADHCITELALGHKGPLPEVRVDLPQTNGSGGSVWVTGAPFGGSEQSVVLTMRPGVVGDRRRRTEPHWMGGPQLRIFTFGRSRVESGEGALSGTWLGHKPGQVLKYLVTHRHRLVPTDELIDVLWPDAGPRGDRSVRTAVHTLRDHLEPDREKRTGSAFISSRSGGYELERSAIWIDADDFELSVKEGLKAIAAGDPETAEAALSRATGLYRGEFFGEEAYADWAFPERERLRDLASQAMRALASVKAANGDLEGATEQLQRLAEEEKHDLDIQRELLALLLRRGRHADAMRRYELVRHRYRKAFNDDVGFDLADVARQVNGNGTGADGGALPGG